MSRSPALACLAVTLGLTLAVPTPALAWGGQGHVVIASLARAYLSDGAKARIDALLATDKDPLTAGDMLARAPWADAWRNGHPETTEWHFIDLMLDKPDLVANYHGRPASLVPASLGPEKDCITGRLIAFQREMADPKTPDAERAFALKFVLHLVGDIHQPLHAADHDDQGGNCIRLDLGPELGDRRLSNLHSYWDSGVLRDFGATTGEIAGKLKAKITPAQRQAWTAGPTPFAPEAWAMESYELARTVTYDLPARPTCDDKAPPMALPAGYRDKAAPVIELQLEKAAVRLAWVLEETFGDKPAAKMRPRR